MTREGSVWLPETRLPLSTFSLKNLLTVIDGNRYNSYHRLKRYERDAQQLVDDVKALNDGMAAVRAALESGDLKALLAMVPEPVAGKEPAPKDTFATHARQFAASRAAGR